MRETASKFISLKPKEEVLEIVREDFMAHLFGFLLAVIWFVTPFFFMFPLFRNGLWGVLLFLALVGTAVLFGLHKFFKWSRTVMIITDRRLVDVEQRSAFDRVVSEVPFGNIEDVSYRIKGLFSTMFRLGEFRVHCVGNAADIVFCNVRRPSKIQDLVNDLRAAFFDEDREDKEDILRSLLDEMSMDEIRELRSSLRGKKREQALKDWSEDMEQQDESLTH
jgi:hypothetical protein